MKLMHRFLALMLCLVLAVTALPGAFAEAVADAIDAPAAEMPAPEVQPQADQPAAIPEPAEPETEAPAEPETEVPAEPETEAPAEPETEAPAEPEAEAPAEPETEAPAEPETEAPAEPETEAPAEPETEAPAEPETEAPAEPETEAPAEPETEPAEEPAETAEDSVRSADEIPDFRRGYAELLHPAMGFDGASPDAGSLVYLEKGILYAADRRAGSSCDRLEVYFDGGKEEMCVWVDARNLRPLSEEEAESYVAYRIGIDGVRYHGGDASLPLGAPFYSSAITFTISRDTESDNTPAMLVGQTGIRLGAGDKQTLDVSFSDGKSHQVSYASEDAAVATVSDQGVVTAKSAGSTSIHITSEHGNEAVVAVEVVAAPTGITVTAARNTIGIGETLQLVPTITPEGTQGTLEIWSSKPDVASVDANGLVTGKKGGNANFGMRTYNGLKGTYRVYVVKAPSSVKVEAARYELGVGESVQLSHSVNKGAAGAVRYSSADDNIAAITPEGVVTAIAPGRVEITATAYNGVKGSAVFTVKAAPERIIPAQESVSISEKDSWVLDYSVNEGAAAASASFASSDSAVASVDNKGKITAHKKGVAEITVTAYNGVSAVCTVTVVPAPTGITVTAARNTIGIGETLQLVPTITPEGTQGTLEIWSSKPDIASVDANGLITGKKAGNANFGVRTYNGLKATYRVYVVKAPSSVKVEAARYELGVGESVQLSHSVNKGAAGAVRYSSADDNIAAITPEGVVTAIAPGRVEITATAYNGVKGSAVFTVKAAPERIIPAQESVSISEKDSWVLDYSVNEGAAAASASFASSDSAVASVDNKGKITAHKKGVAEITVTAYNGVSAVCTVTVVPAPTGITVTAARNTIGIGETLQLVPTITPEGTQGTLEIWSSKPDIASVDENGLITGKKAGNANFGVRTYNGLKATYRVYVVKAPSSVKVEAARYELGVGESVQLSHSVNKGAAGAVRYSSADDNIAAITPEGVVTAIAPGRVEITATAYNGVKGSAVFTVKEAPSAIIPAQESVSISEKDSWVLDYSVNEGAAAASASFASSDSAVASVDNKGKITAHKKGVAEITVTAYNGVSAVCTVTVVPAPTGITVTAARNTIGIGETLQLVPTITPEGTQGTLEIWSSKPDIASVDANGLVTGKKAGNANFGVRTYNGLKGTYRVYVVKAPSSVKVEAARYELGVGESVQLSHSVNKGAAGAVRYSSADDNIAAITSEGVVTAIAPGRVEITATAYNGVKGSAVFTVKAAPESVAFIPAELNMGVGETCTVVTRLSAGSAGGCSFESSDPSVAKIDPKTGAVKGLAAGSAKLRVRTYNGHEAECTVNVKNAPTGVSFQETSVTISVGDSYQLLPPVVTGTDAASASFTYNSADWKSVHISETGLVTGLKPGNITIAVRTYNEKRGAIKVNVKAAPTSIAFRESAKTLFIGLDYNPEVSFSNGVPGSFTLSSSNPAVATASGRTVHAVSQGTAVITATSFNGLTASFNLTVPALPDSITLKPAGHTLGAGDSITLKAVMPEGQGSALTFTSSNPSIAAVDANGKVTGVAPGRATIRVRTQNDLTSECAVTVLKAPSMAVLTPHKAFYCIDEGGMQLSLALGSKQEGGRYAFTSSDTNVASVDANGKVSFKGLGTVQITVETYNGHSDVCTLTIGEKPGKISFASSGCKLALGDSISIPVVFDKGCESYTFASADASIASAAGDSITGVATGTTTITVTSRSGLTASCSVTVVPAPTGISISQSEAKMILGSPTKTLQLSADVKGSVGSVYFISSNPRIASVDYRTGLVSARAEGSCEITAFTYDGKHSAKCAVTVLNLLGGVRIGIDPGHQAVADRSKEAIAPGSRVTRNKVASGTRGKATGVAEHVVNLQIGLKLRDALESFGAEVYMTREVADVNISNQQRAKMMNELGVDLVLRVHCNGSSSSSKHGMCIYVRASGAKKAESASAAGKILKYMAKETGAKNNGVKYSDSYTGLNWSTVPSMLMELGYMTNRAEDRKLNDPAYQDLLVRGMINGICEYMGRDLIY